MPLPFIPVAMVALGFYVVRKLGTMKLLEEEGKRIRKEAEVRRRDQARMQQERRRPR